MTHPNNGTLSRDEIDQLKASLDLAEVVRAAGIELKPKGKNLFGLCPFHEDDKPSLSVNPEANLWQCFGCRVGGDVYKFLELREGLKTFPEQYARANELAGKAPAEPRPKKVRVPAKPADGVLPGGFGREALLDQVANLYAARFKENPRGQEYLAGRGLDSHELWEAFRFGLSDGSLRSSLPKEGPILEALRQLGILNERGQEHFHGCLVVPLTHPDFPGVVGFYGRRLDEAEGPGRHRVLAGPLRGVLNWPALQASKRIVLAEGVFDVLALWQAGVREAACLLGSGQVPPDLAVLMDRFHTGEVVLCLDGDDAGQEGANRLAAAFSGRGLAVSQVALPAGSDPNDILLREGPQALKVLCKRAAAATPPEAAEPTENGFALTLGDVTYRLKMVPSLDGRLRARLRVRRGERLHMDRVDLESSRSRQTLVQHLIRHLELSRIEAERHLVALMARADDWAKAHAHKEPDPADRPTEMTADERGEALAFLRDSNLMDRLLEDMEAFGYVGEESGKLLVYLLGISRLLKKPLSGIIRSQSGSGKSSLAELLERLTPPEEVFFCSRISPTALSWVTLDLQHKLIILEEREGGAGADYQIRTLQSKRRISQLVTQKDDQGQQAADFREVKGPVAFLETTTQAVLNPENLTRCYEIFLDESEQQTLRIQDAQRLARLPPSRFDPERVIEGICPRHHNAQRLLQRLPVFIPYAEHISFPTLWLRTRRDNERMLCLIEALALLHQYQREKGVTEDGTAYVLANLDDYHQAYVLTRKSLEQSLHELTPTARDLWALARAYALERSSESPQDVLFTRRDLRLRSSLMEHAVRVSLNELVEMEYAQLVSGSNGKTMFYRLLVLEEEALSGLASLTTPDELQRLVAGSGG